MRIRSRRQQIGGSGMMGIGSVARLRVPWLAFLLALLPGILAPVVTSRADGPDHPLVPDPRDVRTIRTLARGVTYATQLYRRQRWLVHTVVVNLAEPSIDVSIEKGLDHIAGLERVADITSRFDSLHPDSRVLAAVNANFWSAGSNRPIGPTVVHGRILTASKHRNWSAIAFRSENATSIDNYSVRSEVVTHLGSLPVSAYNRRSDSSTLVVYTPFFGASVPFIDTAGIMSASRDTITDESESDSSAIVVIDSLFALDPEYGTPKVQFEYLGIPRANTKLPCRITRIDTGTVEIPAQGGVLSFGKGPFPLFFSLFVGDTFSLASRVVPELDGPVHSMASGTPRLVRNGRMSVEWREEGLRKMRFVSGRYARTAIGLSRDGKRLILVTVESSSRRKGRKGASLYDLSRLLIERGAYQAMNFDGGSSATMVVEGKTVAPAGTAPSRKISTALVISEHRDEKQAK